jgi:uncharacterized protein (DUF952 family)
MSAHIEDVTEDEIRRRMEDMGGLTDLIFHLAEPEVWATRDEAYRPPSIETEGFVHCSTRDQILGVAEAFYPGRDDLVLLTIDTELLDEDTLVYEDLYDHGDLFPHIYGPLPTSAVVSAEPYLEQGKAPA